MHVSPMVRAGDEFVVSFDAPLANRPADQYWMALQRADAPTSDTTGRVILERGDLRVTLRAPGPGDYEIRLHNKYPVKDSHIVARVPVTVLYRAEWQLQGPGID
jgi:hypothetical protein